ncbi:MAG: type II toxin-antitoxin system death-on-curing family toxin [Syntrophaceae bacterium]|nr:type II toxin-antitoxin system death-on-curing family toxin [Syntrophaceae bacterium]
MTGHKEEARGEIVLYQAPDGKVELNIRLERESLWLSQKQMSLLFDKDTDTIGLHLRNIYKEGELEESATTEESSVVQKEGNRQVRRKVRLYNLDAVLSVGYRISSKRGTQFRIWANNVLKEYLIRGYALNEKRLSDRENELQTLKTGIQLLERSIIKQARQLDQAKTFVNIIADFSRGLGILDDYDNERLDIRGLTEKDAAIISYNECKEIIRQIKDEFNSPLFGQEKDSSFKSSIGQIYQSFAGKGLYPSIEEKAATLFYLIVKNHSFIDGNKRIAAAIFLYFLNKNGMLYRQDKTTLIDGNTLASITLMIAESSPSEMETIKRIVVSILNRSSIL